VGWKSEPRRDDRWLNSASSTLINDERAKIHPCKVTGEADGKDRGETLMQLAPPNLGDIQADPTSRYKVTAGARKR